MTKGRLEAFSDAVIAIILTIMVLELRPPHGSLIQALYPLSPKLISYAISFIFMAIYWNNHHHMFQTVRRVNGPVLWANTNLLFWLSLVPFATAWMGENSFAAQPVMVYGIVLIMCAFAYYFLTRALVRSEGQDSPYARALGSDFKGKISLVIYLAGILCALAWPVVSGMLYFLVSLIWLIPDRRFEHVHLNSE